jgi:uncharacterized iron-regulated membrane protein
MSRSSCPQDTQGNRCFAKLFSGFICRLALPPVCSFSSWPATGVLVAFERQIVELVERDIAYVSVPQDPKSGSLNDLLVRHSSPGRPRRADCHPRTQSPSGGHTVFTWPRQTVYVDPYGSAVLGLSSPRIHEFFYAAEQLHRSFGAPLGYKSVGHC